MIVYVLITGLPAGTKGITDEYTSKSGVKRTAKKEREEHIVDRGDDRCAERVEGLVQVVHLRRYAQ